MTLSPASRSSEILLLHAYVDGELDPINAKEFERRLAADPSLAAEHARLETLRQAMRSKLSREPVPPSLRARIVAATAPQATIRPTSGPSWRAMAAAILAAAVIASGATWFIGQQIRADATENIVVAAHIRGLMAAQPFDVVSSDRHSVKPWFNGRIPQAVDVADLARDDFPLAGGRIDVVGGQLAPTIVYRRRQHVISVTAVPAGKPADIVSRSIIDGYNILQWSAHGTIYYVVSDLNTAELAEFAKLFRAATAG